MHSDDCCSLVFMNYATSSHVWFGVLVT